MAGYVFPKAPSFHPTAIHVQKPYLSLTDSGDFLTTYFDCPNQRKWKK
jgi:hypothetical protein